MHTKNYLIIFKKKKKSTKSKNMYGAKLFIRRLHMKEKSIKKEELFIWFGKKN